MIQPIATDVIDAWRALMDQLLCQLENGMELTRRQIAVLLLATPTEQVLEWPIRPGVDN